jgi:hypothetical protein
MADAPALALVFFDPREYGRPRQNLYELNSMFARDASELRV